jgi:predicted dehydrogenase/threonine dehydrogenase-like Zn-dependent dehydrogenase
MKQVEQNYRTGRLRVAEVPAPRVDAGAILVASSVSLISSGTERQLLELARASLVGKAVARPDLVRRVLRNVQRDGVRPTLEKVFAKLDTPIPLGYSLAGRALEIGRDVNGYRVGDRIACAGAGLANHAEINVAPKNLTVPIPTGVDDEDASFVTLGAIALQGVRLAVPTLGERVLVMGLGLIGLLTVQLLKANGCRVLAFDPHADRAMLARELGADMAVSERLAEAVSGFTRGYGADAVLLTASSKSSEPINMAAECSRLKGRIVVVGLVGMTLDREPFYKRELDLRVSMSYGPGRGDPAYELQGRDYPLPYVRWTEQRNMEAFLALVAEGKVTPKRLVTHRFSIGEAEKAYALMESGVPHLGILLTYPEISAEQAPRLLRRAPPPSRMQGNRIAFIGLGNYARGVLLPALRKAPGVTLAAVATSTGLSANNAGEKYGFASVSTDPAAVIAGDDSDTVFIVTRHDSHASLAAQALRAGKHVFCEKPLALDAQGLREAIAAASDARGILAVGFNRRFAPLLLKAKAALEPRSSPLVMIYRVNAGPVSRDSWIQGEAGGGRILGEVCHFVDALSFLAGALPIDVQSVAARDHSDAVSALLRFTDGSTGAIVYSSLGDPGAPKEYIEVFAAGCVIRLDDFRFLSVSSGGKTRKFKSAQDKGQRALVAAFLEATRGEREAPMTLEELFAVSEATFEMENAIRSAAPEAVAAFSER